MACLIKDDEKYCAKNANVLETSLKITEILENSSNNMDVIMPSLAILLAMRDKNLDGTMKSLVFLKSNQFTMIYKLAQQFAPDLEKDIQTHVIKDKS